MDYSATSCFLFLSLSMNVEHPRPPYQHHAGFYRNIMPGEPWEWSPVTDHSLPMSPMRPIFHIPKAYPSGLSGPVPSPTVLVAKIPANGYKKRGLWASIRRLLRFGECLCAILALSQLFGIHSFRFPEFDGRCGHSCAAVLC
jgi:hypothetical protein